MGAVGVQRERFATAAKTRRTLRNGPLPGPDRERGRRQRKVATAVVLALAVIAAGSALWISSLQAAVRAGPWFGGYVDVTVQPGYDFNTPAGDLERNVVLAFVVATPADPCTPRWGAEYSLDDAAAQLGLDARVKELRSHGGDASVSFGGAVNDELATVCTDPGSLLGAYRQVVERYALKMVDFDVEAGNLVDLTAATRRAQAVAALQRERALSGKPLGVWLTLPVSPRGLTDEGTTTVEAMIKAGVDLSGVNLMTMNYGASRSAGQSMADASLAAATAAHSQLSIIYQRAGKSLDSQTVWAMIGLTPMAGENEISTDVFTLDAAQALHDFAVERGVGRMSFWSLNRDRPCPAGTPSAAAGTGNGASHICSGTTAPAGAFVTTLGTGMAGPGAADPSFKGSMR
ncbi:chitinase [Arthrobacter sp. 35W]|uniref:chitinase n=1 Tax=Arthrobacter sp. 35W TaxID=1132441 RepID=UPI0012DF36B2|nr:chitinase [Arthrobacter sp. 35W]